MNSTWASANVFFERTRLMNLRYTKACVVVLGMVLYRPVLSFDADMRAGTQPDSVEAIELGRRVYFDGIGPDGQPIRARAAGDVPIQGSLLTCLSCHKRSGLGSSEGSVVVPPITRDILYGARAASATSIYDRRAAVSDAGRAYTDEALRTAILRGIDPQGRLLSPVMPRYELDDRTAGALIGFLKTLAYKPAAGVTESEIHFATVFAGAVTPAKRSAVLKLINAYFDARNAGGRHEEKRAKFPPIHMKNMYQAFRKWRLHVWELTGDARKWPEQLAGAYAKQPVFAVLNGIGDATWQPVHEFCESRQLPCLFPSVVLPPPRADQAFYSVYFSRGPEMEGEALAHYLNQRRSSHASVVQVSGANAVSVAASAAFRAAWLRHRRADSLRDVSLPLARSDAQTVWSEVAGTPADTLILWLDDAELSALKRSTIQPDVHLVLSGSLWRDRTRLPTELGDRIEVIHPLALPAEQKRSLNRLELWLRQRRIPLTEPLLQANAYFALLLAGDTLEHLLGYFSRDYFLETIEHSLDKFKYRSLYPRMSLGVGQRYAVKGCYILPFRSLGKEDIEKDAVWVVGSGSP